jgi:plastocyanin
MLTNHKKMKKLILLLSISILTSTYSAQINHTVSTAGMSFSPSSLTINANDTVTFICTSGTHNVNGTQATFPNNPESFGNSLGSGWTFQHIFTIAGTYDYHCDPHAGGGMVGSIIVQQSTGNLVIVGVYGFYTSSGWLNRKSITF